MLRRKVYKVTLLIMSGFVVLFVFRLIYGYGLIELDIDNDYAGYSFDFRQSKKNYASEKYGYSPPESAGIQVKELSQKYEKTATVKSKSENFEDDERKIKASISGYKGIIQYEENTGKTGNRQLHLLIGIQPETFDSFYVEVKKIGKLAATDIIKVDKTSEYKDLNAKKASLESMKESLVALKNQKGSIEEYINLEDRILGIEEQLQGLSVQLGDFSEENEFCTVKFSLIETSKPIPIRFMHRVKVAFEWTVAYYLQFLLIVAIAAFSAFFVLLAIDKLKILVNVLKKMSEK